MIQTKRIYDPATPNDGFRVLVDRLWPRGVSKAVARLDAWERELAPSSELRHWYGHDPRKWDEFQARYARELQTPAAQAALDRLARLASTGTLTLVYAAHAGEISNAAALRQLVLNRPAHNGEARDRGVNTHAEDNNHGAPAAGGLGAPPLGTGDWPG
jgi:uncharacterized protein YeaO (DUF488 family)